MKILKEFDSEMEKVDALEKQSKRLLIELEELELSIFKRFGITHVDREPPFACWRICGVDRYFDTPRQAVECLEKLVVSEFVETNYLSDMDRQRLKEMLNS